MNELEVFEQKNLSLMNDFVAVLKHKKEVEKQEKMIKAQLEKEFEEAGIKSFECDFLKITRVAASESVSVDLKEFEKAEPENYAGLLKDYPKITKRKAYVRFDVK